MGVVRHMVALVMVGIVVQLRLVSIVGVSGVMGWVGMVRQLGCVGNYAHAAPYWA